MHKNAYSATTLDTSLDTRMNQVQVGCPNPSRKPMLTVHENVVIEFVLNENSYGN